ncbi:radical SAM-linked protein [Lachnospiraceae bacterium]|nr:radical SAM-linked protein [Lachnospiraceae bacterium]
MKAGNKVIRLKFSKHGLMKYIGHLDVMRSFQKVVRRSGIDVAYSDGYSPHQIMSFAQPLGVGLESNGEYFDLEVQSADTTEKMMAALNEQCPEGIRILDAVQLPEKSPNAMASVNQASYTVRFREGHMPSFDIKHAAEDFLNAETVTVTKKTKKSTREIDIRSLVFDLVVLNNEDELNAYNEKNGIKTDCGSSEDRDTTVDFGAAAFPVIKMRVMASSGDNVKPGLLMQALSDRNNGGEIGDTDLMIIREDLFDESGKSLIEAGERF